MYIIKRKTPVDGLFVSGWLSACHVCEDIDDYKIRELNS